MKRADIIKRLDVLIKRKAFVRDGYICQRCGKKHSVILQPHHIIGRGNKRLRWDALNIITLCKSCHYAQTKHPLDFIIYFETKYPKRWEYLKEHRNEIFKTTLPNLLMKLSELGGEID